MNRFSCGQLTGAILPDYYRDVLFLSDRRELSLAPWRLCFARMREPDEAKQQFLALLQEALGNSSFARLSLGGHIGADRTLKNVLVRPVLLRDELKLSFVFRHATRDITKNFAPEIGCRQISDWLGTQFRTAYLSTTRQTAQLEYRTGRNARFTVGKPVRTEPVTLEHDRPKKRILDLNTAPWLRDLGVTTAHGDVAKGMEGKLRQIHRFIELLQPLFVGARLLPEPGLPHQPPSDTPIVAPSPLHIADMGCGKGYLTVATYAWLRQCGVSALVRGLERRPELVQAANELARKHHLDGLSFQAGDIATTPLPNVHVLIALHACDTATDDAIANGIEADAALIVVSPCCHQELRPQLQTPPALASISKHGILLERQAELLTDALRAALLEWAGYETRVIEFVPTEHTHKNLLLTGTKRRIIGPRAELEQRVQELASFWNLKHQRLAARLKFDLTRAWSR